MALQSYFSGMDEFLDFCGQKWKPVRHGELSFSLWHAPIRREWLYFSIELEFVPPWLDDEDFESEHRSFHVDVHGCLPKLGDWRALAGFDLESRDELVLGDQKVLSELSGPEVSMWSHGLGGIRDHARDAWDTSLKFGRWEGDGYELTFDLEAFYPGAEAKQASSEMIRQEVAELFGEDPGQPIDESLLSKGWKFHYHGRVRFEKLTCVVPVNAADPIGWAKKLAERELKAKEFGWCRVNGGHMWDGTFKPEHGVSEAGRLVILDMPSDYFREWQAQQEKSKRRGKSAQE